MLDNKEPSATLDTFLYNENRFSFVKNSSPEKAEEVYDAAKAAVESRWERIEALKSL